MAKRSYKTYESKSAFLKDLNEVVALSKKVYRGEIVYAIRSLMENNAKLFGALSPGDVKAGRFENAYVSQGAYEVLKEHKGEKKISFKALSLRYEHVVPATLHYEELLALSKDGPIGERDFEDFMEKKFLICVITKEENKRLNKAGLRQTMPDDWEKGGDAWARYNAVDPKITCKKFTDWEQ